MKKLGTITDKFHSHFEGIKRIAADELGSLLRERVATKEYWWLTKNSLKYMQENGILK